MTYSHKNYVLRPLLAIAIGASVVAVACTPKSETPMLEPSEQTITVNPVEEYAKSIYLSDEYIDILKPLGGDNNLDDDDKKAVDYAKRISGMGLISDSARKMAIGYLASGKVREYDTACISLESVSYESFDRMHELGIDDDVITYISMVSSLSDKGFARYALENALCIEDKQLTELEKDFLKDPNQYSNQLCDYYLSQINDVNFLTELKRQSDFRNVGVKQVELAEDLTALAPYKYLGGEDGINYDEIYTIGIQDKIEYNSVVQGLLWFLIDKEPGDIDNKPWGVLTRSSQIPNFLRYVWANASESKNYQSDRWNWEEAQKRLNAPIPIAAFFKGVGIYDLEKFKRADPYWQFPKENITVKKGICQDQARAALYLLLENGWEFTTDFEANKDKPVAAMVVSMKYFPEGHVECICTDPSRSNGFYSIGSTQTNQGYIKGPYSTIDQAFKSIYANPEVIQIRDVSTNVLKEWHVKK